MFSISCPYDVNEMEGWLWNGTFECYGCYYIALVLISNVRSNLYFSREQPNSVCKCQDGGCRCCCRHLYVLVTYLPAHQVLWVCPMSARCPVSRSCSAQLWLHEPAELCRPPGKRYRLMSMRNTGIESWFDWDKNDASLVCASYVTAEISNLFCMHYYSNTVIQADSFYESFTELHYSKSSSWKIVWFTYCCHRWRDHAGDVSPLYKIRCGIQSWRKISHNWWIFVYFTDLISLFEILCNN